MSEQSEAKRDGARLQKNSGRGWRQKGDAILDDLVIDYKEYEKSFGLSRKVWAKVCTDALKNGSRFYPVLKVILGDKEKIRLAVISWDYLEYLKDCEYRLVEER